MTFWNKNNEMYYLTCVKLLGGLILATISKHNIYTYITLWKMTAAVEVKNNNIFYLKNCKLYFQNNILVLFVDCEFDQFSLLKGLAQSKNLPSLRRI